MQFSSLRQGSRKTPLLAPQIVKTMKLLSVFLTVFLIQLSARTNAQQVNYTAKAGSLKDAFASLEKQTGFVFFVASEDIAKAKPVSVDLKNETLPKALELLMKDQPLEYTIKGNTVFIKAKTPSAPAKSTAMIEELSAPPPPIDVHGTVTDSLGNPLVGALVKVKNSASKGALTNESGEFQLKQLSTDAVLVISFIGYGTREISVGNRTDIRATLRVVDKELAEVAIQSYSNGYQKIPKERATGSFSFEDNKLFNQRVSKDVISRLDGNIPGLIFQKNTQAAGTGYGDINIRGHNTLLADDRPLIVVDNFAYDGDLSSINPNDVESITVLKDAAAASIWGVRSGNGVIVITTKRGMRNAPARVDFNSNVSITGKPRIFTNPGFLNSKDYIDFETKFFNQGFYDGTLASPINLVSPVVQILADQRAGKISASDAAAKLNALANVDVRNDVDKYFNQKAINQQYNLNISGGGGNSSYYFSLGYDNGLGSNVSSTNDRITLKSNYSFTPIRNLTFSADVNYLQAQSKAGNNNGLFSEYPYRQYADANGTPLAIGQDYSQYYKDSLAKLGFLNLDYKPLAELGYSSSSSKTTDNRIALAASYRFLNGFNLSVQYQYQKSSIASETRQGDSAYYTRKMIDQFAQRASNGTFTYPLPLGSILSQGFLFQTSQQARAQLSYNRAFTEKHEVSALAGAEVRQNVGTYTENLMYGLNSLTGNTLSTIDFANTYPTNPLGNARIPAPGGSAVVKTDNFISYFGNAAYTYKNRYTFTASGRVDHSNLFGVATNQKAVPLYSIGASAILSDESFYHLAWVPYLRARVTYGYNGNINKSVAAITTVNANNNSIYSGLPWYQISVPGNPSLQWEKIRTINFGLDFALKNKIVSGSIEYYLKNGINLFGSSPLAPSTGLTTFVGNTASTIGHGFDLQLNSRNISNKNFSWRTNFWISHVSDKVDKYDVKNTVSYYIQTGTSVLTPLAGATQYAVFAYRWAGLSDKGDPQGILGGKVSTDYASILKNNNFDSMLYIGSARPTLFGSLRNTFEWKGFSLSFLIQYYFNYYFRRSSISDATFVTQGGAGNSDYANSWKKPGDEAITNVPLTTFSSNFNRATFYNFSEALVEKGDQIRLKEITLSYSINRSKFKKLPFENLQLYTYLSDLGLIWTANKKGVDPDNPTQLLPKTFAIGLRANF